MTLTAEQIAEKVLPLYSEEWPNELPTENDEERKWINERDTEIQKQRTELTTLIRDLQKQTWDQACKAQTLLMKQPDPTFIGERCVICDPVWASQTKIGPGIPLDYKCQCGNVVRYVDNMDGISYHVCHSALGDYPTPPFNPEK